MTTNNTSSLPADLIGISKGDRIGYLVDGKYESAIVLAVGTDGVTVDGGLWLRWDEVLPGF